MNLSMKAIAGPRAQDEPKKKTLEAKPPSNASYLSLQLFEESLLCAVCAVVVASDGEGGGARREGGLPGLCFIRAGLDEVFQALVINVGIFPLLLALAVKVLPCSASEMSTCCDSVR